MGSSSLMLSWQTASSPSTGTRPALSQSICSPPHLSASMCPASITSPPAFDLDCSLFWESHPRLRHRLRLVEWGIRLGALFEKNTILTLTQLPKQNFTEDRSPQSRIFWFPLARVILAHVCIAESW